MLATRENITGYIPQRAPMVMIHDLVEASDSHAVTQLKVETENIFVEDNVLTEPGLVENIAQTGAALVGYQCSKKKTTVPVGYIVAVKDLKIAKLPAAGSEITTSVRIVNQVLEVTLAQGEVKQHGEICCSCEMRIFVKS
jgi:3-hydroxyacyl-[acyl-carrier-protein] dehydratase